MAHPTAQSAQHSSPVFLYRLAIVIVLTGQSGILAGRNVRRLLEAEVKQVLNQHFNRRGMAEECRRTCG
jgi:hypothetical protein